MLLMIDNYDSFTYTLVQYFQALGEDVVVKRNDQVSLTEIEALNPDRIVISPGPCTPAEAGLSKKIIQHFYQSKPILGVCLGHQAIAECFGAKVKRADKVMHGKTSNVTHHATPLFASIDDPMTVTRYHSLIVEEASLPDELKATAWVSDSKELMAIEHTKYPLVGVQFHPESVLTKKGAKLLANFLEY